MQCLILLINLCVYSIIYTMFNGLLTMNPDIIKVLFANLMHNYFIKSIVFLYMF